METKKSGNNQLQISKWKTLNCTLVVLDITHINKALTQHNAEKVHGIIGADILENGKALIDYNKRFLYLKK